MSDTVERFEVDENGYFLGSDGCHYENKRELLRTVKFKLCGCGDPESAYNFLYEVLNLCDTRLTFIEDRFDKIKEMVRENPAIVTEILLNMLDHMELLMHGTGISSAWTTPAGEQIIDEGPYPTEETKT